MQWIKSTITYIILGICQYNLDIMENLSEIGRWLIFAGLGLAVLGGLFWLVGRIPGLDQFPGTLRYQGEGFSCTFPLLASIVISVVLTIVLNLVVRLLNR